MCIPLSALSLCDVDGEILSKRLFTLVDDVENPNLVAFTARSGFSQVHEEEREISGGD